jgi:hypothetical protein
VLLSRGDTFQRDITFTDPGDDSWTVTIDYDDGTAPVTFVASTRTFSLNRQYTDDGVHRVVVSIDDGTAVTTDTFDVNVALAPDQILDSDTATAAPGETATLSADDDNSGVQADLSFQRDANDAGDASVLLAIYGDSNPTTRPQPGEFVEINVENGSPNDSLVLRYTPGFTADTYEVGFFDETQNPARWVRLDAQITVDANGVLTIVFPPGTKFDFTVFAVSVSNTVTQTGTVTPPTVQAGNAVQQSIASQVTFTSRTQLTVTVSASQDTSLAPVGLSQGTASSRLTTAASGSGKDVEEEEEWWDVFRLRNRPDEGENRKQEQPPRDARDNLPPREEEEETPPQEEMPTSDDLDIYFTTAQS